MEPCVTFVMSRNGACRKDKALYRTTRWNRNPEVLCFLRRLHVTSHKLIMNHLWQLIFGIALVLRKLCAFNFSELNSHEKSVSLVWVPSFHRCMSWSPELSLTQHCHDSVPDLHELHGNTLTERNYFMHCLWWELCGFKEYWGFCLFWDGCWVYISDYLPLFYYLCFASLEKRTK